MERLGGPQTVSTWRLSVGTTLVSAGLLIAALGAANVASSILTTIGVGPGIAGWAGIAIAGLLIPVTLYIVAHLVGTQSPFDRGIRLGTGLGVVGVCVFLVLVPPPATARPVTILAAMPYAGGVVLALWSVVASAAATPRQAPVSVQTTPTTSESHASAADGGEDDDIRFPNEDD